MPNTKKGNVTREAIYVAAKNLFAKRGFKDVTLADICKKSKTQLGTVTYYFPKKTDLVSAIFADYASSVDAYVKAQVPGLEPRPHYGVVVMLYYWGIYKDERYRRFYQEVIEAYSPHEILRSVKAIVYPGVVRTDSPDYEMFSRADDAIRREFNLAFIEEGDFSLEAVKKLVRDIHVVNARLFATTIDEIEEIVEFASTFLNHRPSCKVTIL